MFFKLTTLYGSVLYCNYLILPILLCHIDVLGLVPRPLGNIDLEIKTAIYGEGFNQRFLSYTDKGNTLIFFPISNLHWILELCSWILEPWSQSYIMY